MFWKYAANLAAKLLCNFIKIALRHGCSRVNLLHIFRTPFPKNTSGRLLVYSTHSLCIVIFIVLSVLIVHCLLKILKRFKEMCRQMKSFRCFIKWPLKSALFLDHELLTVKLNVFCFNLSASCLVYDYLWNRKQRIKI